MNKKSKDTINTLLICHDYVFRQPEKRQKSVICRRNIATLKPLQNALF
ncbi:MAG: hypothetical protein IKN18_03285 [Neisseriaceae bacterium]|nr:hypothetical protein [Neisseriaceae bacterium]